MFNELKINSDILEAINNLGHTKPTKIQGLSIPLIITNKDVIGQSATGSGKTLAFGVGIMQKVIPGKGLQGLVLTPTRELAEQVMNSLKELSRKLKIITVYGGVAINPQIDGLMKADVVVATPGRLLDHIGRGTINLSRINILVLDEADRMLDMGFIDDVEQIIRRCPKERQTLFFSATISQEIKKLAHRYMENPEVVNATQQVDPSKLKQVYYDITRNVKLSLLVHLLKHDTTGLVMVFCNTRRTVDFVVKNLKVNNVSAVAIHGGFTQSKRSKTLDMFNNDKVQVLVCTDVAARGLHIDNVSHVYNYEIPKSPKDYVHRIGRTARAGEEGIAVNLLSKEDHDNFGRIVYEYRNFKVEKLEKPYVEMVTIKQVTESSGGRFSRGGPRRNSGPRRSGSSGPRRSSGRSNASGPKRNFRR